MTRAILFASVCALCLSANAVQAADPASPLLSAAPSA